MDRVDSKELLWLHFWCQAFPPIIFMMEKCVHFDIWNKKYFENCKGSLYDLAHFSNFQPNPNLKNKPNHPLNFFIPNIKMHIFFHHKNVGGNCLAPKMKP